jgi:hypothetical protein
VKISRRQTACQNLAKAIRGVGKDEVRICVKRDGKEGNIFATMGVISFLPFSPSIAEGRMRELFPSFRDAGGEREIALSYPVVRWLRSASSLAWASV